MLWAGDSVFKNAVKAIHGGGYYFPLSRFNIDHIGSSTRNGSVQLRVKIELDFAVQ